MGYLSFKGPENSMVRPQFPEGIGLLCYSPYFWMSKAGGEP